MIRFPFGRTGVRAFTRSGVGRAGCSSGLSAAGGGDSWDTGRGGLPMAGMPSKGDLRLGTLASGSKSVTLGVFMVIGNEPIRQNIVGDGAWMTGINFVGRQLLIIRTREDG